MLWAILAVLGVLLVLFWVVAPRVVPWADQLTRLNAGAGAKAEWMAPPQVVEEVIWNYREAQEWVTTCAEDWGRFAEGLERYATGAYFKQQARVLGSLVDSKPRLAAELTAAHAYSVRYFSSDGMQCLLIDSQTARTVRTASYWTGRLLHEQHLDDAALVYRMAYELGEKRWKIERLVQQLPLGTPLEAKPAQKARVRVAAGLPTTVGRDS
jgi:hypothetical protein